MKVKFTDEFGNVNVFKPTSVRTLTFYVPSEMEVGQVWTVSADVGTFLSVSWYFKSEEAARELFNKVEALI